MNEPSGHAADEAAVETDDQTSSVAAKGKQKVREPSGSEDGDQAKEEVKDQAVETNVHSAPVLQAGQNTEVLHLESPPTSGSPKGSVYTDLILSPDIDTSGPDPSGQFDNPSPQAVDKALCNCSRLYRVRLNKFYSSARLVRLYLVFSDIVALVLSSLSSWGANVSHFD
ncbi:hypothetical protein LWI29_025802 [Acer saccharum]|uniref:Uncharacterized protein n=1 Tax=Acer saccharum TaxID=4024 RepID=A0AA39RDR2_ACESA|nr:hypothetical protein LWI29_025802 [Acer saccharum]